MSDKMTIEYQEVKFGEIARQIAKRVDPSETSLDIYVGLEHLDPDSLKITRHGVPSDVKGEKLLVKQGQIIFGKRRAYQRKVAVADWDCICSAHAMVLEAIPGKILPDFLPFFMQSNQFMERAVEISEGSLSPTIKWKVLADQKFIIPTKDYQIELIELLKKIETCIGYYNLTITKLEKFREVFLVNTFFELKSSIEKKPISNYCVETSKRVVKSDFDIDKPYLGFEHLVPGKITIKSFGNLEELESQKLSFDEGDILYGKIRPYLRKSVLCNFEGTCSSDLTVLKPNKRIGLCLASLFATKYFSKIAMGTVKGIKMPRADWSLLKNIEINAYDDKKIDKVKEILENLIKMEERFVKNISIANNFKKNLVSHNL